MSRTIVPRSVSVRWFLTCAVPSIVALIFASPVRAAGDGIVQTQPPPQTRPAPAPSSAPSATSGSPDFLFGAPRGWVSLRGGMLFPRAGGDLFSFVTDTLTLSKSDFRARAFTAEAGFALAPDVDVVATFDVANHGASSEYRHFMASNQQPITQETHLDQMGLSAGVRVTPFGKGRRISRYAFIPKRVTPYVGGGLATAFYSFWQQGQFVDYVDRSVFVDQFNSDGWAIGPYASFGADLQVWKRLYVTLDGRYSWLHSGLGSDFSGFNGIDLAGFRAGTGISVGF